MAPIKTITLSLVLLAGVLAPLAPPARAQPVAGTVAAAGSEERVKAAYLFRLLNYVEFPTRSGERAAAPYVVGVLEDEIVADDLAQLEVSVRRLAEGSALGGVDVLFISRSERARQPAILKQLRSAPVLTVTETAEALEQGSIINFRIVDGHVRFEISLPAADQAGIRLSSRLLALAVKVVKAD
jgi:hypothetical protein